MWGFYQDTLHDLTGSGNFSSYCFAEDCLFIRAQRGSQADEAWIADEKEMQ
jgi:hypothetical protein